MTLLETIREIEYAASIQPAVHMIVRNDIFRLNAVPDAKYGVFGWLQNQHTASVDSSTIAYSFTFFYVDRLTADKGNQMEIQSVGIQTLDNIIRQLDEQGVWSEREYTFTTFNQRFMDECAGVFCNVTLDVPVTSACLEEFDYYIADDITIY